ncbi:MAG: acyltransferase [Pseudomonadales bacterium]|nr:acyltransferase [Pseudomonadales bacterium]MBO6596004.1 acyltransferase [Pseudomonadales bacterium]MBO6822487.1 acyltransferase [Pseudomonadales bacterium]
MISNAVLYVSSFIVKLFPETRLFNSKNWLYRLAGITIGENTRICSSCTFLGSGSLHIGKDCWLGHQSLIISGSSVIIGDRVDIAPMVYIGTGSHEIDKLDARAAGSGTNQNIQIHDGVWLGAKSAILPGVTIGTNSVVAAGAIVTEDVPDHSLVAGIPARVVRKLDESSELS